MNQKKVVFALAFIAICGVAIFQYIQISDLKSAVWTKSLDIDMRDLDYAELQSNFTAMEVKLDQTELELRQLRGALNRSEASLRIAKASVDELNYSRRIDAHILAVRDGGGVSIPLEIELKKGTGRVLVDINDIYLEDDVQSTIKTAFALADVMSNGDLSDKDITIHIVNPYVKSITISGMSSGAAMTTSLIALGRDQTLKKDVVVTGVINGDGSIGRVSYIKQKAEAAKNLNATVMLVPRGEKISVPGITLIEVSNIEDVIEYMIE